MIAGLWHDLGTRDQRTRVPEQFSLDFCQFSGNVNIFWQGWHTVEISLIMESAHYGLKEDDKTSNKIKRIF